MSRNFILPEGWEYKNLLELVAVIGGVGYTPKDITGEGIRVIRGGNIQDSIVVLREDDVFLPVNYKNESNTLYKGDIVLVASTGSVEALGRTATVWEDMPNVQIGAFLRILRPKSIKIAPLVSAWLCSEHYFKYIRRVAKGTSINNIGKEHLRNFKIPVPTEEILSSVSQFYININRKISLNRSINAELERMAKEIYDYWFVQFEFPRSVSGESGLPELSRTDDGNGQSQFPDANGRPYKSSGGAMVYNPVLKREVPEGWEVKTLKDIATFTNGLACQKFRPTDENKLPVIKIREMHGGFSADTEFVKSNIPEKVKVYNGDVLFSWSASLEVMLWAYGNGGLNQHIFKVTSNNGWPKSFYYYQLLSYVDVFKKMAEARKTTMGHITEEHLEQSRIIVPNSVALAEQLESKIAPIFDKIVATSEEITLLQNQRELLLPLLMTGQVKIK